MSKIFQAYKKQVIGLPEMSERLHRVGNQQLFQPPHKTQQEEFAKLSHRLLTLKDENRGAVYTIASSVAGEGASFVSYSVATILALVYEQKVVWIDSNFRSPQKKLQTMTGPTFADLLRDPDLVVKLPCQVSQITMVPAGPDLDEERASFTDSSSTKLFAALTSRFDFVLIDAPPVLESQDTALIAKRTQGLLLVVAHRKLKRESISSGIRSLREIGVNVLGAVMNRREYDLPGFLHKRF